MSQLTEAGQWFRHACHYMALSRNPLTPTRFPLLEGGFGARLISQQILADCPFFLGAKGFPVKTFRSPDQPAYCMKNWRVGPVQLASVFGNP